MDLRLLSFRPGRLALFAFLLMAGTHAVARQGDLLQPYLFYTVTKDNNILLSPSNEKSDQYQRFGVGTILDWNQSRQEVTGRISADRTVFSNFSVLNYSGYDFLGQWNWQLGNYLNGQLGYSKSRSLGSFLDFTGSLSQNTVDDSKKFVSASYLVHPRWRVNGALDSEDLIYSAASLSSNNRTVNHVEISADYLTPMGSGLTMYAGTWRGDYSDPKVSTSNYKQDEIGLRANWAMLGKLSVNAQLAQTRRNQELAPQFDFSGLTGSLTANWLATGKLNLAGSVYRSIYAAQNVYSIYSVNDGIRLTPNWQITPKIRVSLNTYYERRNYAGNTNTLLCSKFFGVCVPIIHRQDDARGHTLSLIYAPSDWTSLSLSYQASSRKSTYSQFEFSDQSLSLSAQAQF